MTDRERRDELDRSPRHAAVDSRTTDAEGQHHEEQQVVGPARDVVDAESEERLGAMKQCLSSEMGGVKQDARQGCEMSVRRLRVGKPGQSGNGVYGVAMDWEMRLRELGQRSTPARRAVLAIIAGTAEHLSADDIALAVAGQAPDVHRATVFRTLDRIVSLGVVAHVHLPHGATTYHLREPLERMHLHLLCRSCGRVFDIEAGLLDEVAARVAALSWFELEPDHTALSGRCAECRDERG